VPPRRKLLYGNGYQLPTTNRQHITSSKGSSPVSIIRNSATLQHSISISFSPDVDVNKLSYCSQLNMKLINQHPRKMIGRNRSTAQSFANFCTIFILVIVIQHASDVQGFVTKSTRTTFSSSSSSEIYYGYAQLQSKRFISNPFARGQQRINNRRTTDFAHEMADSGSLGVPKPKARVSRIIPFKRRNITVRNVKNFHRTKHHFSTGRFRKFFLAFASMAFGLVARPTLTLAMGAMGGASKGPVAPVSKKDALSLFGVFFGLFLVLALLHAAEIAITTLYPWKVREFAEEVSLKYWTLAFVLSFQILLSNVLPFFSFDGFCTEGGEKWQGGDVQNLE
jgi:hypothetical protein